MPRLGLFPNGNPRPEAREIYANGWEGEGEERQGRDPRQMTPEELRTLGHGQPLLRAIRVNCIECCAGAEGEVRRCRMVWCPFWPYRMGSNPFHKQSLSPEKRAALSERMRTLRQAGHVREGG